MGWRTERASEAAAELRQHLDFVSLDRAQAVIVLGGDATALERGGEALDNVGFLFFEDPDGNAWAVQQISARGR